MSFGHELYEYYAKIAIWWLAYNTMRDVIVHICFKKNFLTLNVLKSKYLTGSYIVGHVQKIYRFQY